ncbi:MAG: insulinase family protein [Acidobacteriota bacterium]
MKRWGLAALAVLLPATVATPAATATTGHAPAGTVAKVPVETFTLDNGMTFLLVEKPELTTVVAGWVAHVGSANEQVGQTGIAHFFEHMMFKGSKTIGTKDIKRDLEIMAEQERLQDEIRAWYRKQRERWRRGEIDDPFDPANRPPELVELEKKFQKLVEEQRELMVKDEFDKIYTAEGGTRMNAFTNQDMTVYFITVPANKIELWFWMESDRLLNNVRREFYSERDVVHEERRLRTESTPTGKFDELFNAMFWQAHPYRNPVVGWPSDLRVLSAAQADAFYRTYYAPNNLTAAIVGNFDKAEVRKLAERYFGRLERQPPPPDVVTLEMEQLAEKRMRAECDCQPQVELRYHTVPFMHRDSYALDVLASLLNGRTGRLYKALVLDQKIAASAGAGQNSQKWAGAFSLFAESKGDATPADLEAALVRELDRLRTEPIPDEELQKVKNQIIADNYRRLESPFFLMIQLLYYDGLGDWRYLNTNAENLLAVTADDVKRVVETYFRPENRAVAHYYRKAGTQAEPVPEELADLPEQAQKQILAQARQLRAIEDADQLRQILAQVQQQKGAAPPQFAKAIAYLEQVITERLAALEAAEGGE